MINTEKLKRRMKASGITQSTLAAQIGISGSLLSMKIKNRRAMTLNEAEAIAKILGISDDEFGEYFLTFFVA